MQKEIALTPGISTISLLSLVRERIEVRLSTLISSNPIGVCNNKFIFRNEYLLNNKTTPTLPSPLKGRGFYSPGVATL